MLRERVHHRPSRAAATTRPPARRRRRRTLLIVLVVALLAYPVGATLFLWTGAFEKMMESEDLRIEIDNPSWTLWPGHIHVAGARVLVNGETQFRLQAKNLLLHVNLFALPKKRLSVTSISADDARYFMRVQVESTKGIEQRIAAYPDLDDLPGDPTIVKKKAAQTEPREGDFTVEVSGIDVKVSELWFMEYHFLGKGTLKGGFLVGPHKMAVNTSVQELGPGELRFGADHVIAKQFGGKVTATIPELNPEEHADESFLELVTADIDLKGDVQTLSHVGAYTVPVRVVNGAGPFDAHVVLEKGRLGKNSRLSFSTEKVGVRGHGYGVDTDWTFDARVAEAELPRVLSKSSATYVSFSNERGDVFTVQLLNHDQSVVLRDTQLGRMTDIEHARAHFPEIFTKDLDDLAALTAEDALIEAKGGEARASLTLDVNEEHVARGPLKATFDGLEFTAADMTFSGRGELRTNIVADLDRKVTTVRDLFLRLTDIGMHAGDEDVKGWWAHIDVPRFTTTGIPPKKMEGKVVVLAKSAEPVLKALAEKDEISDIVPALTNLNNLRVNADFRKAEDVTDVMMEPVENSVVDVAGRYYQKGEDGRFAVVVGGKAVSLGLAKDASGLSLMPFARSGWLNEKLGAFPQPKEKVESSQP